MNQVCNIIVLQCALKAEEQPRDTLQLQHQVRESGMLQFDNTVMNHSYTQGLVSLHLPTYLPTRALKIHQPMSATSYPIN